MDSKSREQGEVKELMFHSGGVVIVHGARNPCRAGYDVEIWAFSACVYLIFYDPSTPTIPRCRIIFVSHACTALNPYACVYEHI